MSNAFEIVPFPGHPNEFFIGIDPCGYDGRIATYCVMKKETNSGIEVVAQYKGPPNNDFKTQIQEYIDYYKIPAESIARFDKQ